MSFVPAVLGAPQIPDEENRGDNDNVAQAQATLGSLFGPRATLPHLPNMKGSVALPSFDSKEIQIDEGTVSTEAHRGKRLTENVER